VVVEVEEEEEAAAVVAEGSTMLPEEQTDSVAGRMTFSLLCFCVQNGDGLSVANDG
jgi:hypothetical protein